MMTRDNNIIPTELQPYHRSESDVSILIGENGSGKSQMLARLAAVSYTHLDVYKRQA